MESSPRVAPGTPRGIEAIEGIEGIDTSRASAARMYDYYLGGTHHLPADVELARQVVELLPETPLIMRANRAFLQRAVRYCAGAGIRQFLDIGSGIPTQGPVHEVARATDPGIKVVYVDNDDAAALHAAELLADDPLSEAVQGDLRDVDGVLGHPGVRRLIDFDEPVALLFLSVLQFIPDEDDPRALVARYRDALAPGSHLALSHATDEGLTAQAPGITEIYSRSANPIRYRSRDFVLGLFDGFDLVRPGLAKLMEWRPDGTPEERELAARVHGAAGVGVKPRSTSR
ncbi:SAM-dependent methyltransferase [Streptomyces uncialis]|uniref:SAM-dependent methyltransferase n=1 Tax=Streptomyces uncialis TaxID=1048205 RepID=UPI00364EBBCB